MPFDPTKPAPGDDLDAVLIRAQLNAHKALIDAHTAQISSLQAQLNAAIAGTAQNIPGVAALGITISDPPQQAEVQATADKVDEMINGLRR